MKNMKTLTFRFSLSTVKYLLDIDNDNKVLDFIISDVLNLEKAKNTP